MRPRIVVQSLSQPAPDFRLDSTASTCQPADNGAPRGNPADMPPPLKFDGELEWVLEEDELWDYLKEKGVTGRTYSTRQRTT